MITPQEDLKMETIGKRMEIATYEVQDLSN